MAASPRAAVMLACATLVALASGFKTTGPALLATRAPRSAAWRCASAVSQAQSAPARIGALPPPRSSSEVPKYALNDGAGVMTNILGGLSLDQSGASPRGLGLRPARYLRTSDGLICMMSETSGVPVPHDTIVEKVIKPKGIMGLPPSPHMLTRHLIGGPRSRRTLSTARYTIAYYIELLTRTIEPLLGEGDFRGVLEFLKNAESDHEQVQQNHEQVQQSLKYTTLLEKNLRTTEFEFACFKSRTESTLLTRQHVETLLGLMRISNGSPTAQANLFGASLVRLFLSFIFSLLTFNF
ncbi:hypothetical protein T492DRAFT_547332 [Pavlovales sp. CCMP2436]|nr:hypothetical protein T492DRAFT_547332 [Pavlovales sp. CCMP2436]